jgi:hypothetical protein
MNPNDIEGIKKSNHEALKKERIRDRERTPDANKNRKGKYGLVNSQEYIGGHRLTFDSTPGSRVVEVAHGSGTYWQVAEDGKETKVTVGNSHQHYKEGVTISIDQNGDIKIAGHARIVIGGGAHIEVKGDVNLVTAGDMTQFIGGNMNQVIGGDLNQHVGGKVSLTSGGTNDIVAGGDIKVSAPRIDLN